MLVILILIFILVFGCFKWRSHCVGVVTTLNEIPAFPGKLPFIGHLLIFLRSPVTEMISNMIDELKEFGQTCYLRIFTKYVIIIQTPEDAQKVLISNNSLGKYRDIYAFIHGFTGKHLIVANAHDWAPLRRNFNSTNSTPNILRCIPQINLVARKLVGDYESNLCGKATKDILPISSYRVMEIMLLTQLGIDIEDDDRLKRIQDKAKELFNYTVHMISNIWYYYFLIKLQLLMKTDRHELELTLSYYNEFKTLVLNKREEYYKEFGSDDDDQSNDIFLKRLCRMRYENLIDENEFIDNIVGWTIGGTETSIFSLPSFIVCLAMYPDIQEKCFNEIQSLTAEDEDLSIETLSRLEYFDRVVKESQRLLPSVEVLGREATDDIHLTKGVIKRGTPIVISVKSLHQNKLEWGANAGEFNPDNFLPQAVAKRHRCSFVPFSYGSRDCIGRRLGDLKVKIMAVYLIRRFRFETKLKLSELMCSRIASFLENKHLVKVSKR